MRRILDLRITHWGWKLVYVVAVLIIGPIPARIGESLGVPELGFVAGATIRVGMILLAARIFRGNGEAIEPPRPWWQMTARPKLSRRLGILFTILLALDVAGTVLGAVGVMDSTAPVISIVSIIETGLFAYLFLNSAVRLRRTGVESSEPTFTPKRLPVG